jgi:hypothetical protein
MHGQLPFGGSVVFSEADFINASVKLYSKQALWNKAQKQGFEIIKQRFQKKLFSEDFKRQIRQLSEHIERHRQQNFLGQILQHHTLQSTKYMGKWIEAKNGKS